MNQENEMGVDDGDEDRECGRCHETMHIPPGAEPSEFCHDCAHSLVDELRAERDQFKAMWERDSTALGKALAQRDTARTDAEDKRARVSELEAAGRAALQAENQQLRDWRDSATMSCAKRKCATRERDLREAENERDEANKVCEQLRQWTVATRADNEALRARVAELEKALQFMLNVFGQDGLGDGAEGDAVEHARKAMRLPSNKGESRDGT